MNLRVLLLALPTAALLSGCGKVVTKMNHNIPTNTNPRKPSGECNAVNRSLFALLSDQRGFTGTSIAALANGACAVTAMFDSTDNILPAMKLVRAQSKSYTYFYSGKTLVNIWIDTPPTLFKDPNGKVAEYTVSDADCNSARDALKKNGPDGNYATAVDPTKTTGSRRCYVDAKFANESAFESFVKWSNPSGDKHEPFHYYLPQGTITKTVWIHAIAPI